MSVNLEIRNLLPKDALVFDNMSYDNSIIGTTLDGRVIYDYNLMIEELISDEEGWSYNDAIDWIEYNTLRSLGYFDGKTPLVVSNVWT